MLKYGLHHDAIEGLLGKREIMSISNHIHALAKIDVAGNQFNTRKLLERLETRAPVASANHQNAPRKWPGHG